MNIDYTKLGYRWRGAYSTSNVYINKDVVYKDGAAFYFDSSTQSFKIFARGQAEAISKGELIVGGNNIVKGIDGQVLLIREGEVTFEHHIQRNGTICVALGGKADNWMGTVSFPSVGQNVFVMSDGTVRGTGRSLNGLLGDGDRDEGRGHITPIRINFPNGTAPIVKARTSHYATHFIDRDGVLWGCGYGNAVGNGSTDDVPVPSNVSENSDIGSNKIVEVYQFHDIFGGQHAFFALDENGRVYSWGTNGGNVLGYSGGTNPTARLLEFTQDNPIKNIMSSARYVTGMITTDGRLFTVGSGGWNLVGNDTSTFTHVDYLPDKVAEFHASSSRGHWNNGDYNIVTVVLEDGRMFYRANGWGQLGWGLPDPSTSNSMSDNSALLGEDVARSFVKHGGYAQGIVQRKDGYWYYRGCNRHDMSPTLGNIEPTSVSDWYQIQHRLNDKYFNSSVTKAIFVGENLRFTGMMLDNQGRCFSIGANASGQRGLGHTYESVINASPDVDFNHHTNDYVLLNEKVIDIESGGWHRHTTSAYQDYLAYFYLTENGNVYVTGSGYYGQNNMWPSVDTYVPTKINF